MMNLELICYNSYKFYINSYNNNNKAVINIDTDYYIYLESFNPNYNRGY